MGSDTHAENWETAAATAEAKKPDTKAMLSALHSAFEKAQDEGRIPDWLYAVYYGKTREGEDGQTEGYGLLFRAGEGPNLTEVLEFLSTILAPLLEDGTIEVLQLAPISEAVDPNNNAIIWESMLHIRYPGEGFWATPIGNNQAIVRNMLMEPPFTFGAVIEYDEQRQYVRTIEDHYRPGVAYYRLPQGADPNTPEGDELIRKRYHEASAYLEAKDIQCEGWMLGMLGCAIPIAMAPDDAMAYAKSAPGNIIVRLHDSGANPAHKAAVLLAKAKAVLEQVDDDGLMEPPDGDTRMLVIDEIINVLDGQDG